MEDPYQILNLEPDSHIDEVHRAFGYIHKLYHPDKGGNSAEYLRFLQAYRTIVNMHEVQNNHSRQLAAAPVQCRQQSVTPDDYTYNVDELAAAAKDRDAKEYKRQYSQVTAEAERITPMFGRGASFNSQTFNKVFMQMKKRHRKKEHGPEEPDAAVVGGNGVELSDPQCRKEQSEYDQAFESCPQNPQNYSRAYLESLKSEPDPTAVDKLSMAEMKQRMASYQMAQLAGNKERMPPPQSMPADIQGAMTHQSMRDRDQFSRMLELRNPMITTYPPPQQHYPPPQPHYQQPHQPQMQQQHYQHQQQPQQHYQQPQMQQQQPQPQMQQPHYQQPQMQQQQPHPQMQQPHYQQPQMQQQHQQPPQQSTSIKMIGRPPPIKKSKARVEPDEITAMRKIIKQQERLIQQMIGAQPK
jgi:hypothetical protein